MIVLSLNTLKAYVYVCIYVYLHNVVDTGAGEGGLQYIPSENQLGANGSIFDWFQVVQLLAK